MGYLARGGAAGRRARVGAAALLVSLLAVPVVAAPSASAQDSEIGSAKAIAVVVKVAPTVGALQLALGSGVSVAEVQNKVAQAQATSMDLGIVGSTLTTDHCDGSASSIKPSDLPQPLRVDNRAGNAHARTADAKVAPGTLEGSVSEVWASPEPSSSAESTASTVDLGPLLHVRGGKATTKTEFLDGGATRVATAEVTADISIPNVLEIKGLHWEAVHSTGKVKKATATFSIGSIKALGQSIPADKVDQKTLFKTLNTILNPAGITLVQPTYERVTTPTDFVRINPMLVIYSGTPLQATLLGPILDATRSLRDALAAAVVKANCNTSTAFLLEEVGIGQVTGSGSTEIAVGGAEAATGSQILKNPFGNVDPLPPVTSTPPIAAIPGSAGHTIDLSTPGAPAAETPVAPPAQIQPIGSFEKICQSVHPFRWPHCSAGAGPFVGIGALLATAGIVAFDVAHQRRRTGRRRPEATV